MDQNSVDNQNNPDKMRALHFSSLVFHAKHFFKSAPGIISLVVIFVMLWLGVATVFSRLSIKGKTTPMLASSEKVKSLIENEVTNYRVSVNFPGGKIKQYKLEDLGITLNVDKTVAASRKKQKNIKSRIVWWQAQEVDLQYDVNKDKLRSFITKEIDIALQPAKEASLNIVNGQIVLTDSADGFQYSIDKPDETILNVVEKLDTTPITLQKLSLSPEMTSELLKPYKETLDKTVSQPITFKIGTRVVTPTSADIANWLDVSPNATTKKIDISVNSGKVIEYINRIASGSIRPARNQVVVKRADGSEQVITSGINGSDVLDKSKIAANISNNLLEAKGISAELPVSYQPFQTVTSDYYPKWIEVNITTKRMYVHEYASVVRTFLVSAGAPATPTVTGQYKILTKLVSQDMSGANVDGSRYFQPRVPYVNYFYGGYAIHGNYWRPASWFGNINSSHGCVGLMTADAEWLYYWAPIGTPVIIYK
jgi:lipoprotein-anchoring transpeptidase ErfK/SrfK